MANNQVRLEELGIFALLAHALAMQSPGVSMSLRQPVREGAAPVPKRGLLDRLDHWFWKRDQRAMEAHLAQAKDVYELEVRIRDLERRVPHPYF